MADSGGNIVPFTGQPEADRVPADMLLDGTRDLGEATYSWNIETDVMTWGLEATHIFGVRDIGALSSGTAFATLIDQASPHSRHSEVFESERRDQGTGVSFTAVISSIPRLACVSGSRIPAVGSRTNRAAPASCMASAVAFWHRPRKKLHSLPSGISTPRPGRSPARISAMLWPMPS